MSILSGGGFKVIAPAPVKKPSAGLFGTPHIQTPESSQSFLEQSKAYEEQEAKAKAAEALKAKPASILSGNSFGVQKPAAASPVAEAPRAAAAKMMRRQAGIGQLVTRMKE